MDDFNADDRDPGWGMVQTLFRPILEGALDDLLKGELLDWIRDIAEDTGRIPLRNGYYTRTIQSLVGPLELRIPRDRAGEFKTALLKPYDRRFPDVGEMIVRLYGGGMTVEQVSEVLTSQTGSHISPSTIQSVVSSVYGRAERFNTREIPDCSVVFLDGTWLPLRRAIGKTGQYDRECVMVAMGYRRDGRKEVLGFRIAAGEGSSEWEEFLEDLRERGLRDPVLFVTDGLQGMPSAIGRVFPRARHQTCLIHVQRNLMRAAGRRRASEISSDFLKLLSAEDTEDAERILESFIERWGSYSRVRALRDNRSLLTFTLFPLKVRRSIYSTNVIESFNSRMKRDLRKRISLNSEEHAVYLIARECESYNASKRMRPIDGFYDMTDDELASIGMSR